MRWTAAIILLVLSCASSQAACPSRDTIAAATAPDGQVVALIGNVPITSYDWQQAVALRVALEGSTPDASALKAIAVAELAQLKTGAAWMREARSRDIAVAPSEVDRAITAMLARDHVTAIELAARLRCGGVAMATLRSHVAVAIAHAKATGAKVTLPFRIAIHR